MDHQETHALFAQGKDAWNAWAEDMLAKKNAMQDSGQWKDTAEAIFLTLQEPRKFNAEVDFCGWIFPGEAFFKAAEFPGDVSFEQAIFHGGAWFESATFVRNARFEKTMFGGEARFESTKFSGNAHFKDASFYGLAGFVRTTFCGVAFYEGVKFRATATFVQATFKNYALFDKATFQKGAYFEAIRCEGAFTLADSTFEKVPDFIQAHFEEAPCLDNVAIQPECIDGDRVLNVGDPDVSARWRALKRLAIQGHDHVREQYFFSNEIKSARFVTDWPLRLACSNWAPPNDDADQSRPWYAYIPFNLFQASVWEGFPRCVFGVFYQIFSNFGRSVWRPTLAFLVLTLLSATVYLGESQIAGGNKPSLFAQRLAGTAIELLPFNSNFRPTYKCATVSGQNLQSLDPEIAAKTDALSEAMHLSWTNGSIVGGLGGLDSARRTYGCLYGLIEDSGQNATPIMPATVSIIATWQKAISVILIFLFGLAIRNMLKMH